MEISKGIEIIDLALWIPAEKALVVADFHAGFEESLNREGVFVPRFHFSDIIKRLEAIFLKVSPETIIVNGDLKHEFGSISEQEWREALKILDFLALHCKRLCLVKGNHDTILGPIAGKRGIEIADFAEIGNILVCHGDRLPSALKGCSKNPSVIIIGHEHPAVSLQEGGRVEKFKCFLKGKYKSSVLIVQPSFNLVTEGTDVLRQKTLSPFLNQDISKFEAFVVGDKIYNFGRISDLKMRMA